jgi:glycosyltransferase involved in cell wall biosynthesis
MTLVQTAKLFAPLARTWTTHWSPYSRLFLLGDRAGWSLDEDMKALAGMARQLGIHVVKTRLLTGTDRQCVFYSSLDQLLRSPLMDRNWRTGAAWFHGLPGQGNAVFDRRFEQMKKMHHRIARIQVSNSAFRTIALESGIAPEKVFLIPIGINLDLFSPQTSETKAQARAVFHIPEDAAVVGSFQKDGEGWSDGLQPKYIKGPDILVKVLQQVQAQVPGLYVLLSGPARGYVKQGLEKAGIPYRHVYLKNYRDIGRLYQCLDACLVTSREEGGPKAVLESMAGGVPLVTTRVGQAVDLVKHGQNAFMTAVEDVDALTHWTVYVLTNRERLDAVIKYARETAEGNAYAAQMNLWRTFFNGFTA